MDSTYQFGYFIVSLLFLTLWLILFLFKKDLRQKMLILSFLIMLAGPISEFWYLKDYWRPYYIFKLPIGGLEDLIFGFAIGGIAGVFYEAIFINHICLCQQKKLKQEWFLLVFIIVIVSAMILFNNLLGVNSIFASMIGMLVAGILMIVIRPDLLINAVASGVMVAATMFIVYFIPLILFKPQAYYYLQKVWLLYHSQLGILILGRVPLTEVLWGFSWGFAWGPFYEFVVGARTLRLKI